MSQSIKISAEVADGLLRNLRQEEEALAKADEKFRQAMAMYQLAIARYCAVRDAVEIQLGRSPYDTDVVREMWPEVEETGESPWEHPAFGRYQYLGKKVGDAVIDALRNWNRPMSLETLTIALSGGGLPVTARAVNASLLNLNGVNKMEDGTYVYEAPQAPPDDSPNLYVVGEPRIS